MSLAVGFGEVPGWRTQQTRVRSKANASSFPLHYQAQASWRILLPRSRAGAFGARDFSLHFFHFACLFCPLFCLFFFKVLQIFCKMSIDVGFVVKHGQHCQLPV
jgi:hypothetical protein